MAANWADSRVFLSAGRRVDERVEYWAEPRVASKAAAMDAHWVV